MVIKVQQLKKTSFDRILAFSAEGSDNRRSQDSSLLSILLEEMGLLDMVYILKRVWGKGKWLSPEGGPCPDQFWRSPELSLSLSLSLSLPLSLSLSFFFLSHHFFVQIRWEKLHVGRISLL